MSGEIVLLFSVVKELIPPEEKIYSMIDDCEFNDYKYS